MRAKGIAAMFFVVMAASFTVLSPTVADADENAIRLLSSDKVKDLTQPLVENPQVTFDTHRDSDGTIHFYSPEDVKLNTCEAYLTVSSSIGEAYVKAIVYGVSGYLSLTGLCIRLSDGGITSSAVLNGMNDYADYIRDDKGEPLKFRSGVLYHLDVSTADAYDSTSEPEGFSDLLFSFECYSVSQGDLDERVEVRFLSDGVLVESRDIDIHGTLGQLPIIAKTGYDFNGWLSGSSFVHGSTMVRDLESPIIIASWVLSDNVGDSDIWPKHRETMTVEINQFGQTVVTVISLTEYEDSSIREVVTISVYEYDELIWMKRSVQWTTSEGRCQFDIECVGDRVYIRLPEISPVLID